MIPRTYNIRTVGDSRSDIFQKLAAYVPLGLVTVGFLCCLVIELCDVAISNENRNLLYDVMCIVSSFFGVFLHTIHGKYYGLSRRKACAFSFASFVIVFMCLSEVWTRLDILVFGAGSTAAFRSMIFLPLLCRILSRFCDQNTWNLCDFLTPYFFFILGFTALTCWIAGCCAGKPMAWGLQNPLNGMTVFPLQPCVILASVAVAWWGLRYAQKHDYQANGMVFANSLILYGIFRYLVEFFSDDPRIFGVLSWLSVCSLFMIAMGFLVRYIVTKHTQTP